MFKLNNYFNSIVITSSYHLFNKGGKRHIKVENGFPKSNQPKRAMYTMIKIELSTIDYVPTKIAGLQYE